MERRARVTFAAATGGVEPYTYEIIGCELPPGLRFSPDARSLSGTPLEAYARGPDCTYEVTDSDSPPVSVSRDFELIVDPLDRGIWRFRTRTVEPSDYPLNRQISVPQTFTTLPHALGGSGNARYELRDIGQGPLKFDASTRELSYNHTGVDPLFDTPTTFRYSVSAGIRDDDALCVDVAYRDPPPRSDIPSDGLLSTVRIRSVTMRIGTARSIGVQTLRRDRHRPPAPRRPTPSTPCSRPFTHGAPSMSPTLPFGIAFEAGRPTIRTRLTPSTR